MQRGKLYSLHRKNLFQLCTNLDVEYYSLGAISKIGRTQFCVFLKTKSTQLK